MKPRTEPAPCIVFPVMDRLGGLGGAHPRFRNRTICLPTYCKGHPEMGWLLPSLTLKQPTLPQSKRRKTGDPATRHPKGIAENP